MELTTDFDWEAVREYFDRKAVCLAQTEKEPKTHLWRGFSPDRYTVYEIDGRRFVTVMSKTFEGILVSDLPRAVIQHPELFGTGSPDDVVEALHNVRSGFEHLNIEEYRQKLADEVFCWIVEIDTSTGLPIDRFVRVDLYRDTENNELRGGILHAFKHFSWNGKPLSYGKDCNELESPGEIIGLIIEGFFLVPLTPDRRATDFVSFTDYEKGRLKFVFHHRGACGVYFVTSIYRDQ